MKEIAVKDVQWHPKTNRISQIPKEGLEFAMLSNNYRQLNQLVWCKDFMQDVIWSHVNQKSISIYGFKYDPKVSPPPSMRRVRLLVSNYKDPDLGNKLINNMLPLIHSVESRLKMTKTVIEKCKSPPPLYRKSGVWIVNGCQRWLQAAPMLSFYTLLIRIGLVHKAGDSLETTIYKIRTGATKPYFDQYGRDKNMVTEAVDGIETILKYGDKMVFPQDLVGNYPTKYMPSTGVKEDMSIFTIHDRCGIVGFSKERTKYYFPQWHKAKER